MFKNAVGNLHEGKVVVQVPIRKQSRIPRVEANLDLISLIITIQYSLYSQAKFIRVSRLNSLLNIRLTSLRNFQQ
jgi:hypothetical protein